MGFDFAKYDTGGNYLNAGEKKAVAEAGIPFLITSVKEGEYDGEPRYVLSVTVPNPETGDDEERLMAFPINSGVESRDRMLAALKTYLEGAAPVKADPENGVEAVKAVAPGEPVSAKLEKIGRAYLIREA